MRYNVNMKLRAITKTLNKSKVKHIIRNFLFFNFIQVVYANIN